LTLRDRLAEKKEGNFDCRECVCGYTCGTDKAWKKHLDNSSAEHYPIWAEPSDARRASCYRWPFEARGFCLCRIPCSEVICEETLDEVFPGLFLGSLPAAWKVDELRAAGVTKVLDFSRRPYHQHDGFEYWTIVDCKDNPREKIRRYFDKCGEWIDQGLQAGEGVLVHCHWGASRSATIVLAYLVLFKKMRLDAALEMVYGQRPDANPNSGFMRQLQQLAFVHALGDAPPAQEDTDSD